MKKILFICSQNRLRSPTAEQIFSTYPEIEVASAGLNNDAIVPLSPDLLEWANIIFVMEKSHLNKLRKKFKIYIKTQKIVCLNIPDEYAFMSSDLVMLLKRKVHPFLGYNNPEGSN